MSSFNTSFSTRRTFSHDNHHSPSSMSPLNSLSPSSSSSSLPKQGPSSLVKELPGYQTKTPLLFSSPPMTPTNPNNSNDTHKGNMENILKGDSSYKNREYLYWERGTSSISPSSTSTNASIDTSSNTSYLRPRQQQQQQSIDKIDNDHQNYQIGFPPTATINDLKGMFSNPVLMSLSNEEGGGFFPTPHRTPSFPSIKNQGGEPLKDERSLSTIKELSPSSLGDENAFWISIFGFSGQLKSCNSLGIVIIDSILDLFEQMGDMLPPTYSKEELIRLSMVNGFINIGFKSKWSAQKALEMNGQILQIPGVLLDNGIMIGCIPMQKAMAEVERISQSSFLSPIKRESLKNDLNGPFGLDFTSNNRSIEDCEMLKRSPFTSNSGLVSENKNILQSGALKSPLKVPRSVQKGLDYVFGW